MLDLRFIIPGPTSGSVLLSADGRLPDQLVDGDADEATVVAATAWLRQGLAFAPPILETHPKADGVPDGEPIPTLVMTEPAPTDWRPPAGLDFASIATSILVDDLPVSIRPRAAELLAELRTGSEPPALRPRWARRGWNARATAWMSEALAAAGRPLLEPPRPFYLRGISALLRGRTAAGDVFLKAVFPPFHLEPDVARLLAQRFPQDVPNVLAVEPDEGWLIMDDIAAPLIGELPAEAKRRGLIAGAHAIARLQGSLAGDLAQFTRAGCPVRPIEDLATALATVLGPDAVAHAESPIPAARRERVVAATGDAADRVAALGLPTTIVHGDFHPGNVALARDRAIIIDWSDAAIGNPAIDLVTWLSWSKDQPDDRRIATDAWIAAWSGSIDPGAARAVIEDILAVGAAYQVVSYEGIVRALEPATRYTMIDGAKDNLDQLEARIKGA